MKKSIKLSNEQQQIIIYQTEDGRTKIDVCLENETVWLSQMQMAELFNTTVPNINIHIKNVYADNELSPNATIKDYLIDWSFRGRDKETKIKLSFWLGWCYIILTHDMVS